jgi:hypothetical protein
MFDEALKYFLNALGVKKDNTNLNDLAAAYLGAQILKKWYECASITQLDIAVNSSEERNLSTRQLYSITEDALKPLQNNKQLIELVKNGMLELFNPEGNLNPSDFPGSYKKKNPLFYKFFKEEILSPILKEVGYA